MDCSLPHWCHAWSTAQRSAHCQRQSGGARSGCTCCPSSHRSQHLQRQNCAQTQQRPDGTSPSASKRGKSLVLCCHEVALTMHPAADGRTYCLLPVIDTIRNGIKHHSRAPLMGRLQGGTGCCLRRPQYRAAASRHPQSSPGLGTACHGRMEHSSGVTQAKCSLHAKLARLQCLCNLDHCAVSTGAAHGPKLYSDTWLLASSCTLPV